MNSFSVLGSSQEKQHLQCAREVKPKKKIQNTCNDDGLVENVLVQVILMPGCNNTLYSIIIYNSIF